MENNPVLQQLQQEASRRGLGLGNSSAGLGQNPSASSPIQQGQPQPQMPSGGGTPQPTMQKPATPSAQDPFAGAAQMMGQAAPSGGTFLEKALVKRLNLYPPA